MREAEMKSHKKLEWFWKPVDPSGGGPPLISNAMLLVWTSREDLQKAFDIQGEEGLLRFYLWWLKNGRKEYGSMPFVPTASLKSYLDRPSDAIPQDSSGPILRRLYLLWCLERDLQVKFDLEKPRGRQALLDWWESTGRHKTNKLTELEDGAATFLTESVNEETDERPKHSSVARTALKSSGTFLSGGVNIIGFAMGELGLGEDVRTAARALKARQIPFCIYNAPIYTESRAWDYRAQCHLVEAPVYKTNIVFLPASDTLRIFLSAGAGLFMNRYTIGAWQWELPRVPSGLREIYRLVDEIWASSRYTADAYRASTPSAEVRYMRLAVEIETVPEGDRPSFGLPEDTFLFLFVFDSLSRVARKNPLAAVEAFRRAFPRSNRDVGLVIKCMNVRAEDETWRLIIQAREADNRIFLMSDTLPRARLLGLVNCCDALLSLHRAEGFGRTIAEAMLLGKPVIVTNYSGNRDFTTHKTAFLVNGKNIPVKKGEYPFWEGQWWCDPDVDQAAELLRTCFSKKALSSQIARAGQKYLREKYNSNVIGKEYERRLSELGIIQETRGR